MNDSKIYAGIDIGGTNIKFGLFDSTGKILYRAQKPTMAAKGPQPLMHLLTNIGEQLLLYASEEDYNIRHMGVGSPGAVDSQSGQVVGPCPNIDGWTGMSIGRNLEDRLNIPVFVDNDVNAMALGEYNYGVARGVSSLVCATVGTGIGGAVVLDGKILQGASSTAGELGHMTIDLNGPECACGNNGCLESFCSSKRIIGRIKALLNKEMTPVFKEILNDDLKELTIKKLFMAAEKKDPVAIEVISETANYLGLGLAGIVNLLNPEMVVLGGGIVDGDGGFVEKVKEVIRKKAFSSAVTNLKVEKAALGNDAGFIGAGLLGESN